MNMNIEEIKKRLAYLPRELKDGGFSDNSLTFGARLDIEYLLSIIEQAEKALTEFTDKNFQSGSKSDREDYSVMVSCADIYKLRQTLKSIQGDE